MNIKILLSQTIIQILRIFVINCLALEKKTQIYRLYVSLEIETASNIPIKIFLTLV